jgi:hypothetical protein
MAVKAAPAQVVKYFFVDFIGGFVYFPFWWYSRGLKIAAAFCLRQVSDMNEVLGVTIWIKNIFTPMYAQYDIAGRLISFGMRVFQIIFRTFGLLLWTILMAVVLLLWIFVPLFLVYQILFILIGSAFIVPVV